MSISASLVSPATFIASRVKRGLLLLLLENELKTKLPKCNTYMDLSNVYGKKMQNRSDFFDCNIIRFMETTLS